MLQFFTQIHSIVTCLLQKEWNQMLDLKSSIDKLDFNQCLGNRQIWRMYLIIHPQANLEEFPNCTLFTEKISEYFTTVKDDNNLPVRWACCQELHKDEGKYHYVSIQFKSPRRWFPIKNFMLKEYCIALHFLAQHAEYNIAYK